MRKNLSNQAQPLIYPAREVGQNNNDDTSFRWYYPIELLLFLLVVTIVAVGPIFGTELFICTYVPSHSIYGNLTIRFIGIIWVMLVAFLGIFIKIYQAKELKAGGMVLPPRGYKGGR